MKKMISIKYVTNAGELKPAKGVLFNHEGYQYCLTRTNGRWTAYELTTGHTVVYLHEWVNFGLKAHDVREKLKEAVIGVFNKLKVDWENRLSKGININTGYNIKYPVNNPIE